MTSYIDIINVVREGLTEDGAYPAEETLDALRENAPRVGGSELIRILEVYAEASTYATMESCGTEDELWYAAQDAANFNPGYRFTTGGWSGAEDLVDALMPSLGWLLLWQLSVRGGAFYFACPEGPPC